ncbi:MAG: segregation/condensation protein A [Proteobacteria bacterium]|nr:segregation/condensation protein A [Burkholderiales bacterium]
MTLIQNATLDLSPAPELVASVARIHGAPMLNVPQDLYIPPDALQIILESFEGPLDLLLYLIRKQNLDVLDIPMAQLTRQYLEYIDVMTDNRLELAAEYLLMAALLIEIKSRMLLPRPPSALPEESDPRAELARRLLDYEQIKLAAQRLNALPHIDRDFERVHVLFEREALELPPHVDPEDLKAVWLTLLARARLNRHHRITREELSVREHMSRILRRLQDRQYVDFFDLFEATAGVPVIVVNLLALLELARESLIVITQQAPFAPIHVRLAGAASDPPATAIEFASTAIEQK